MSLNPTGALPLEKCALLTHAENAGTTDAQHCYTVQGLQLMKIHDQQINSVEILALHAF